MSKWTLAMLRRANVIKVVTVRAPSRGSCQRSDASRPTRNAVRNRKRRDLPNCQQH